MRYITLIEGLYLMQSVVKEKNVFIVERLKYPFNLTALEFAQYP